MKAEILVGHHAKEKSGGHFIFGQLVLGSLRLFTVQYRTNRYQSVPIDHFVSIVWYSRTYLDTIAEFEGP